VAEPEPSQQRLLSDWYSARALVAAEWAPAILVSLLDGGMSYSRLRVVVQGSRVAEAWNPRHERMHRSTLTRSLKQLTGDGLLLREEIPGAFPRSVQYMLTPAGRDFLNALAPLVEWVADQRALVERARLRRWETNPDTDRDHT